MTFCSSPFYCKQYNLWKAVINSVVCICANRNRHIFQVLIDPLLFYVNCDILSLSFKHKPLAMNLQQGCKREINGGKKIKILGGEVIKGGRGEGGTYTNTMGDQKGLREDKREQQLCEACKREIKGRKEHYLSNCAKNRFAVSKYIKSY